jgi:hypothetical protein
MTMEATTNPVVAAGNDHPRYRVILAVDVEDSTSRTDAAKAEMRRTLYLHLENALDLGGIRAGHRDTFVDRGDGVLVLIRALDTAPKTLLLRTVIPALASSLDSYNAYNAGAAGHLRVRAVVHAGETRHDGRGSFGTVLDVAFRLLDSPKCKDALARAKGALALVVSEDIYRSIVLHDYPGIPAESYRPRVSVAVAGRRYRGWVYDPAVGGPGSGRRLTDALRAVGRRIHAATDARAERHGWQIEERQGGPRRRYRDPRFDRLLACPRCQGEGSSARVACARCRGTGRLTVAPASRAGAP